MSSARLHYIILLSLICIWCVLLFVPPIIAANYGKANIGAELCYNFYDKVCHQYESRSIFIAGHKMGVCARCAGIYLGFFVGILIVPLVKHKYKFDFRSLTLITSPMIIDVTLNIIGMHQSNLFTRSYTGLAFGIFAAILLYPTYQKAFFEILGNKIRKEKLC